jgi:multidrug efflux pump
MLSRFFIDRPIFAWVIALVLMLAGGLSVLRLPIMQFPAIAPPQVGISASYPGASAQTAQDTVVQVIEQQMNGIDGLDYITSESSADGTANVNLTFKQGTDPDIAQVQVQNKLQLAMPLLPQEVQQAGVRVNKPARNFLVVLGFLSTDDSLSGNDMANFVASNVQDATSSSSSASYGRPGSSGEGYVRDSRCARFSMPRATSEDSPVGKTSQSFAFR